MAAEFSGNGKKTIRYAMWERFVDKYDKNNDNTEDVITTVWKIQPPDGYTYVKFMMLSGDTVIRESKTIAYELGKIYHKTAWGKWTKRNGIDSYYDVPVVAEGYWAPNSTASGAIHDSRMLYTTTYDGNMLQARKYEPTAQKVIFHCNSENVWHNIHIEFFEDAEGANPVNGQAFPGYMMEPYAYAGSDYRMSDGYLTYELTIPATAKYFRINNGELTGAFSYKTAIMPLNDGSDASNGKGKKNYGNYWYFGSNYSNYNDHNATLVQWTPQKEEKGATNKIPDKDYKNVEVTSDYDYIYFEKPAGWGDNVYAYFYAGGNLRADNWQRACYSSWPGVAPAGTEYGTVHSNTYSIKTTGDTYNGTNTSGALSPETTISGGTSGTIYKFRIPKGDRTNYSKVIFNNGLTAASGGEETGVIEYQSGHIYTVKGKATKHYENGFTKPYDAKTITVGQTTTTEYLYVKNTAGWDDLHITFYDENGGQIHQPGKGYVMDYAGKLSNVDYFKIPIPEDAAKFSVNNGIGSANANKVSPQADIIRLNSNGTVKATPATTDKFAYELTETSGDIKLTRSTITTQKVVDKQGQETPQEEGFKDYTMIDNPAATGDNKASPKKIPQVRQTTKNDITTDDTLNIRDMAGWDAEIGGISVTFYTDNPETPQIGPNVMMKTVADSQGKIWYTKKIHPNATSFSITYMDKDDSTKIYTTPKYPIYANVATGGTDGQERTESGCMFFDTKDSGADSKLVMTNVEPAKIGNEVDDETYSKRGDFLYIVRTDVATAPHITFYASGTNVIKSGVTAKYINTVTDASPTEYWFKVSIPEGAQSFVIDDVVGMTAQPIYELKAKASVYQKDYTLGDMQYKFNGTATTLVYPVFTETPVDTLTISAGHTLTSKVAVLVDEDAIASYNGTATLPESTGGASPSKEILYNTSTDNVTYSWGGSSSAPDNKLRFDNTGLGWDTVYAYFYDDNDQPKGTGWPGGAMTIAPGDTSGFLSIDVPAGATHVNFNVGNNSNELNVALDSTKLGKNQLYTPNYTAPTDIGGYIFLAFPNNTYNWAYGNIYFYDSSTGNYVGTAWPGTGIHSYNNVQGSPTGSNAYKVPIPTGADSAIYLYGNSQDSGHYYRTVSITLSDIENGKGIYGKTDKETNSSWDQYDSDNNSLDNDYVKYTPTGSVTYNSNVPNNITGGGFTDYTVMTSSGSSPVTASFQPEDRYGMISEQNSSSTPVTAGYADTDNFIYIVVDSSLTDPYINFLDASDNQIGTYSAASAKGIPLKYTGYTGAGTTANPYKIRLPKNAAKFTISNSSTTGTAQLITESNLTAKIGTSQQTITLPSAYYHAGTTFYINSSCNVDSTKNSDGFTAGKKLRTGFTPYKTDTMTDPLKPMSDADFVFFTDTNGTFASSRNKVYAYFYGAADGEYTAWPGTMADSANTTAAATSYINNNGDKVYKFRIPKDDDGNYTKVIFTDGRSSPKITAAQTIEGGTNYILGSYNSSLDYGTMTAANKVYDVTTESKTASPTTAPYNSADNRTIYIIDNGTTCNAADETHQTGGRYILDDMHIEFFGSDGVTHIGTPEGYIPEKAGTHADSTVYRITVPSNAMFFRVNNGNGKDNVTAAHNHTRNSEIKQITDNGLYEFVTAAKYTKDGSNPTTVAALSAPEYLLTLINKIDLDGDAPTSETYDVHLATIKTGANGNTTEILWVKDDLAHVDTNYLVDNSSIPIKVKKDGTYYWKEVTPPSGYTLSSTNIQEFTLPPSGEYTPAQFTNPDIDKGSLTLTKKLHSVDATNGNTAETTQLFTFTIELNAPVGSDWRDFTTNSVALANEGTTGAEIVSDTGITTTSLNRVITVKLPANNSTTVTVSNIPYGTTYNITETAPTNYSSTPVEIKYQNNTIVEEMKGTVNAATTSYLVTDKHEVGSLTLKDVVIDRGANALYYANVNQPKTENGVTYTDYTKYDYYVILEAPEGIDLKDYISLVDLDNIIDFKDTDVNKPSGNTYIEYTDRNGTTSTRSIGDTANRSKYKFHIDVTSSADGAKTISNIPIGTQYSVVEQNPTATYNDTDSGPMATDYTGAGVSWYGTPGVPANDPGTITLNYESEKNNNSPTVTITNYYRHPSASISVEKAIPAGDTDHQDTEFSFVIDFSAGITAFNADNEPDITLAEGDLRYTYSHVNPPATADPSGASFNSTNNQITVTLKPGQKVKIDGVPANIAYTVTETTPRFWESKYTINGVSEQTGYVASDTTVSGTERAVKFTNTYVTPTKATLTLTKATSTFVPSDVSGKLFKFTVTLTPPSTSPANGSFEGYTVSAAKTGDVAVNPSSSSNSQIVYTVYLQSGKSLNITGLPDGTSYVITEDENGYYATESSSITSYTNITRPISVVQSPTPTNGGNAISTSADVTVTNNYTDFGALQLTKTLSKTGDTTYPDSITTATTFPYVVVLTLPSGMEWNQRFIELIGLTYSATNPTGYTVSDAVENSDDNRVITFTKNVSQDVLVTINNIPKDTTYSVTENYNGTSTSGYGYKKIPSSAVTGEIGDSNAVNNVSTAGITNKYYQLGTLDLTKILYSVDGTSSGENVTFPITVVLTCPSGEWSDYEAITGLPTGANAPSETSTTKTIVYNLSSGSSIPTIGHLPYGTTYQISEDLTSLTNYQLKEIKNGSNQTVAENTLKNTGVAVNSASVSYTFTNERKTGSLGLTKTVNGDSTALTAAGIVTTGNNLTAFDYTVDLYAPANVDFRDYLTWSDLKTTLGATSVKLNNTTTVTTESGYTGNSTAVERLTLTVPVTTAGKSIAGLPYGTQYTVVEAYTYTQGDHNLYWEKSGGVDTRSSSYEINSASGSSVGITNNYTLVGSLTLNKDVVKSTGSTISDSVVSNTTPFVYEVTLDRAGTTNLADYISETDITSLSGYVANSIQRTPETGDTVTKYKFQINVSEKVDDNGTLVSGSKTISNIPVGTTYTVTEVYTFNSASNPGINYQKSGEKDSSVAVASRTITAGTNNTTNAVTVVNTYTQVGELDLEKTAQAIDSSTTLPSSVTDANKTFTFTVTLNALSGVDLKKYITYATLTDSNDFGATLTKVNGSASSADYTNNANAVTSIEFTVPVAASGTKSLSDLPYGTQYIVLETGETAPAGYKLVTTGQVEDAAQDEDDAKIGASNSASIVNTYTQLGKLKLVKALGSGIGGKSGTMGGTSVTIGDSTAFTYKVTLTSPNNSSIDLGDYISWTYLTSSASGNLGATVTAINGDSNTTPTQQIYEANTVTSVTFTVSVSQQTAKIINDLPYGTTYSVEEINLPTFTDGSCAVDNSPSGTIGTINTSVADSYYADSGTNYNQAKITNSFVEKGSLTVRKENRTAPGSTQPTYNSQVTLGITLQKIDSNGDPETWSTPSGMTLPSGVTLTPVENDNTSVYFEVDINRDRDVKVLDLIPLGEVKYKVEEVASSADITGWVCTPTYSAGNELTPINASNPTPSVTVTNTYAQTGTLTVKKSTTGNTAIAPASFDFVVKLYKPDQMTNAAFEEFLPSSYTPKPNETSPTYYEVELTSVAAGNTGASISGLPYGTTYEVTEKDGSKLKASNVTVADDNVTDHTDRHIDVSNQSVTVTNDYPYLGSLKLEKIIATGTTYESDNNPQNFSFKVELDNPSGSHIDLRDFISQSFQLGVSTVTIIDANYTAGHIEFAACNKNEDDPSKNSDTSTVSESSEKSEPADPLVGKWQAETLPDYVYTFNADGSGQYNMAGIILEMNYSTENGKITMNYTTEGYSSVTLDYILEDDKLNIKDSFGKDTFYLRVKE